MFLVNILLSFIGFFLIGMGSEKYKNILIKSQISKGNLMILKLLGAAFLFSSLIYSLLVWNIYVGGFLWSFLISISALLVALVFTYLKRF